MSTIGPERPIKPTAPQSAGERGKQRDGDKRKDFDVKGKKLINAENLSVEEFVRAKMNELASRIMSQ